MKNAVKKRITFMSVILIVLTMLVITSCNVTVSPDGNINVQPGTDAQPNTPDYNGETYNIVYRVANNDNYLESLDIENPNPTSYLDSKGLVLEDLFVKGYYFKGWYTAQVDGTRVEEIPVGSSGNKTLYAQWEKVEYTITFDSPDVPVESVTYTVDKETTLKNPSWFGYTFVGWSIDGKIVSRIPVGTTGNITLHANWTSERNKATAITNLADPSIIEDLDNGQYLFLYEIGSIQNVPLSVIEYLGNSAEIEITKEYTYEQSVQEGYAETIANAVSNATTKTSSWILAEEWNSVTSATNEHDEEVGKTEQKTDSEGNTTGGNYYVSNSSGGATSSSTNSGGSSSSSSKVTTSTSTGINGSYHNESEVNTSVDLKVDASLEAGYGPIKAGISAGIATNVNTHDKTTADLSQSRNDSIGTYNESNKSSYWDSTKCNSSNWNTTDGYEESITASMSTEVSNAISQVIFDRYGYTSTESRSENSTATKSTAENQTESKEYSSTVEYSIVNTEKVTKTIKYSSDAAGYYRIVNAGTIHVFGIVGYDIATNSYFTYTYSVLDKERHEFLDYSKENPNFNDCENAILPFEIPYFVHEYVTGIISGTDELTVNYDTGYITEYNGKDDCVIIPEYVSLDNLDGSFSAVRIRGIEAGVFRGKENIKGVYLPKYISEIPDNAFEGCTSLETVIGYGITEIGENAFKDCVSLGEFRIDDKVTKLGTNAFKNAPSVVVDAANKEYVADSAIVSGAKRISLNISNVKESFDNTKINLFETCDYFALISDGKSYSNLKIDSAAKELHISNMKFVNNADTPIVASSETVILNRVTIENAPGFAVILTADDTTLKLYGTVELSSSASDTMISKNVVLEKANSGVAGELKVKGNYLIFGDLGNDKMVSIIDGQLKSIDEATFESMINSSKVSFDANGGEMNESEQTVYYGQKYGTLPVPTRDNYDFAGWFTEANGGIEITSETIVTALVNQTLYAHWTPRTFTITFATNGGSVSPATKELTFGDSYGTLPTPTKQYHTFNGWFTAPSGGTQITASTVPAVAQDTTIYAQWTTDSFTLVFNANGGSVSPANKRVVCGTPYGDLPTPTRTYYTFNGWFTASSGGTRVTSATVNSSTQTVTIYAQWTLNQIALNFDANGGYVSTSSKKVNCTQAYGTLPAPTRDYYDFSGWYTASSGGTLVTASTLANSTQDITLYAHWTLKETSGWVKESDLPAGAQVVNTKWTYTKTETKESYNANEIGWNVIGSYWQQSGTGSSEYADFPATYLKTNTYYTTMNKSAYEAYETATEKREVVNNWAGYIYWHYMYNVKASAYYRCIRDEPGTATNYNNYVYHNDYFRAFKDTKSYTKLGKYYDYGTGTTLVSCGKYGYDTYLAKYGDSNSETSGSCFWYRFDYYTSSYTDYVKVFQYQKITNGLESSSAVTAGGEISNVVKMVQYRPK